MTLLPLLVSVFACAGIEELETEELETEELETQKPCFNSHDQVVDQEWLEMEPGEEDCDGPIGVDVGDCAPDFELPDQDDEVVTLSQYQGRVTVLSTAGWW